MAKFSDLGIEADVIVGKGIDLEEGKESIRTSNADASRSCHIQRQAGRGR